MEKIKVIVEKTGTSYSAYNNSYPGVVSAAKSWDDLKRQYTEAIELHFEGMAEEGENIPENYKLEFVLDLEQFFDFYDIFNVSALAGRIGMNPTLLHQYKDGHKQPSEKTSLKILNGIHALAEDLLSVR